MLKVLAVVALIATSNSLFVDFSEDVVAKYSTADVLVGQAATTLINSDRVLKFHVTEISEDEIDLELDELPGSTQGGHRICGKDLGIDIANFGTFCNLTNFHVAVNTFEELPSSVGSNDYVPDGDAGEVISPEEENRDNDLEKHTMQFTVVFKSSTTPPCSLEIPIFKLPSELESANTNQLQRWAAYNRVGLFPRTNIKKLSDTRQETRLSLDFNWLSNLLQNGVFKNVGNYLDGITDTEVVAFSSRPIVLSGENLEKLKKWISRLYYNSYGYVNSPSD